MNWKRLFYKRKGITPSPIDSVTEVERIAGNTFYLASSLSSLLINDKKTYSNLDMALERDKALAMAVCTPLATVIGRIGSMFSGAEVYVVDKKENEKRSYAEIKNLLLNPNPLQTKSSFLKSVEISLKLYGYCPIFTVRAFPSSLPVAMYVIPAPLFHMESTGKLFRQYEMKDIVEAVYIEWNGSREILYDEDYFVIYDSSFRITGQFQDIQFDSETDSLSSPVNNWIVANKANYRLIANGGPKGFLCNDYVDSLGNKTMTPEEKEGIERKLVRQYGILNEFPIAVSPIKLSWVPLDYDANQLKLNEQDEKCERKIANALNINYNLFNDAKYDNQESAKVSAYQDLVIPDSNKVAEAFTKALCPEGVFVKLDYSHVECLQTDKAKSADVLDKTANALRTLQDGAFITQKEARIYLASLMDINPEEEIETVKKNNDDDER